MGKNKNILSESYKLAWKSFQKWWIPICLISLFIFVFEIIPKIHLSSEFNNLEKTTQKLIKSLLQDDTQRAKLLIFEVQYKSRLILKKIIQSTAIVFPFIALGTIILLMTANWATKDKKGEKKSFITLAYIACIHILLACIKLIAFLLFIIPGIYLYVKLLFVSLLMLEEDMNVWQAVKKSWQLSAGYFTELFLLVVINAILQCILLFTVVGVIPGTGFVNTVRAAAFQLLLQNNRDNRKNN